MHHFVLWSFIAVLAPLTVAAILRAAVMGFSSQTARTASPPPAAGPIGGRPTP